MSTVGFMIGSTAKWLRDNGVGPSQQIIKLSEEVGEASSAFTGCIGANPRKGVTHTFEDLVDELADVAITALNAIAIVDPDTDPMSALHSRLEYVTTRLGIDK